MSSGVHAQQLVEAAGAGDLVAMEKLLGHGTGADDPNPLNGERALLWVRDQGSTYPLHLLSANHFMSK